MTKTEFLKKLQEELEQGMAPAEVRENVESVSYTHLHRKIVVIDGRVGFVGGFNIGREYIGRDKKFGYWRDTHLCIEGSAVTTLAVRFVLDWNLSLIHI